VPSALPSINAKYRRTRTIVNHRETVREACWRGRLQQASITKPPASEAQVDGSGAAVTSVKATGVTPSASKKARFNGIWNWAVEGVPSSELVMPLPIIVNVNVWPSSKVIVGADGPKVGYGNVGETMRVLTIPPYRNVDGWNIPLTMPVRTGPSVVNVSEKVI
jgi:hypothetical protein